MQNIRLNNKKVLITGIAGFIGANLALRLLEKYADITIIGIDNLNDYYDVGLKKYRLSLIDSTAGKNNENWKFIKGDISEADFVKDIFIRYEPDIVVNLAAQAGVRYSIVNPDVYINSNIIGFYNILEACRHSYEGKSNFVEHLVFASSSSVYGGNTKVPFEETDFVDNQNFIIYLVLV